MPPYRSIQPRRPPAALCRRRAHRPRHGPSYRWNGGNSRSPSRTRIQPARRKKPCAVVSKPGLIDPAYFKFQQPSPKQSHVTRVDECGIVSCPSIRHQNRWAISRFFFRYSLLQPTPARPKHKARQLPGRLHVKLLCCAHAFLLAYAAMGAMSSSYLSKRRLSSRYILLALDICGIVFAKRIAYPATSAPIRAVSAQTNAHGSITHALRHAYSNCD